MNEDIKFKRKQTEHLRNRVPKTIKKAEAIEVQSVARVLDEHEYECARAEEG
jgi:hypothetical protein